MGKKIFLGVIFLVVTFALGAEAFAAEKITYLPEKTSVVKDNMQLGINRKTLKGLSGSGGVLSLNKTSNKYAYILRIKHPKADRDKGKVFNNAGTLNFENVGKIDGRSIDATVKLSVYIGPRQAKIAKESSTYVDIGMISNTGIWFGTSNSNTYPFVGVKNVTASVNMTYHDTGDTVKYPFYQLVSDIDMPGKTSPYKWYREGWKPISGYTEYMVYKNHMLDIDEAVPLFQSHKKVPNLQTDDERIRKGGVYGITAAGKFASQYRTGANCGSTFAVFSQYVAEPKGVIRKPVKKVNNVMDISAKPGEIISYTVSFKEPTFMKDLIFPLSALSITDILEDGLTYKSATLTAGGTNLVKSGNATIDYDSGSRKITASMGSLWLKNVNNYKGRKFVLTIKAEVNSVESGKDDTKNEAVRDIKNVAYLNMGTAEDIPSNETTVIVEKTYGVDYKYVSGTVGKELPREISVSSGEYAVKDSCKYMSGETVINKGNDKQETCEGAVRVVKDSSGNITGRWILSWDKESCLCESESVHFVGTWTYVDALKFRVHYYYRSADGKPLPKQISTKNGAFAISDSRVYSDGDTVMRKNEPCVGVNCEIQNNSSKYLGKWTLTKWDKDSHVIDGADAKFVGTWTYKPAPKLIIEKRLQNTKEELNLAHGEPTFTYKISDEKDVWYEAISFDKVSLENTLSKGKYTDLEKGVAYSIDGKFITARKTLIMPEGRYKVTELDANRYEQSSCREYEESANPVVNVFEFTNTKRDNEGFSHSDCVINRLSRGISIPEDGHYVTNGKEELIEGDIFPISKEGDVFELGDYIYTYNCSGEESPVGWYVKVRDTGKEHYGEILEKIGQNPVVSMDGCFEDCFEMVSSPAIPQGVTSMIGAYRNCVEFETAADIPENVENITEAFAGCTGLEGKVRVNGDPQNFEDCFANTVLGIRLCHTCDEKLCRKITATGNNGNVFCGMIPDGGVYFDESEKTTLKDGEEFPESAGKGDIYKLGDYEYGYGMNVTNESSVEGNRWEENGLNTWCVSVLDRGRTSYSNMLSEICSDSVEGLIYTFSGCENLKTSPVISENAVYMNHAFAGCKAMTKGPDIPRCVIDLSYAFSGCKSLNEAVSFKKGGN